MPTPTPTPTVYVPLSFSRNFGGSGKAVELIRPFNRSVVGPGLRSSRLQSDTSKIRVDFFVTDERTVVNFEFQALSSDAPDIKDRSPTFIAYNKNILGIGFIYGMMHTAVAIYGVDASPVTTSLGITPRGAERYIIFGSPTTSADVPALGRTSYNVIMAMYPDDEILADSKRASGTASVNITDRILSMTTTIDGREYKFSGTVNTTSTDNSIDGTITSSDGVLSGEFTGRMFGPNSVELGIVYRLVRSDGASLVGTVLGSNQSPFPR
jgi:hypothetical protein